MLLKVYNTLTRKKEEFKPIKKGEVKMYVCGPTVYDYAHIGHARTYIAFDVIVRYLRYRGYKVKHVSNITDVGHLTEDDAREDKILKKAEKEHVTPFDIAKRYAEEWFNDMDALGVQRPDVSPKATEHIDAILDMVKALIEKGYAYEAGGSVYYDISKFKDYGKLSHQKMDQMKAGARVAVDENKKSPLDFALWKKADKKHAMQWPSPWGNGFPGWHIECSTMSMKYLGDTLDIHGGAKDLIFPHHENEIAQSEAATGKPFVKYWMHTGFLNVAGEKMAKSLGNFITVKDLLKKYDPDVFRLFVLSAHYRSPIDFSEEHLKEAKANVERVRTAIEKLEEALEDAGKRESKEDKGVEKEINAQKSRFVKAMDDDFNTREALAAIFNLVSITNKYLEAGKLSKIVLRKALDTYKELGGVFNLFQEKEVKADKELIRKLAQLVKDFKTEEVKDKTLDGLMNVIIELRETARKKKDYDTADKMRSELAKLGIILEDTSKGVKWKVKTK